MPADKTKKQFILLGIIVFSILLIDQLLKLWVKSTFDQSPVNLLGNWFRMVYVENPGMAFGTTFGSGPWPKLTLSTLRITAIILIVLYIIKQIKLKVNTEFIIIAALILGGATGNLLDSMFYDFIFPFDPCYYYNFQEGSGILHSCTNYGLIEIRPHGFLMGNVVDMFQFNATWPSWMPVLGGNDIFPAVWNVADASISVAVIWIFIRYKHIVPKNLMTEPSANQSLEQHD